MRRRKTTTAAPIAAAFRCLRIHVFLHLYVASMGVSGGQVRAVDINRIMCVFMSP